jgi:hypothetical protein
LEGFRGNDNRNSGSPINLNNLAIPGGSKIIKWLAVILGVLGLLLFIHWARGLYADWLWYSALGYTDILLRIVTTKVMLFIGGLMFVATFIGVNLLIIFRNTRDLTAGPGAPVTNDEYLLFRKLAAWLLGSLTLIIAIIFGYMMATEWNSILMYLNGQPFNAVDPIFNEDISFYVFSLPFIQLIKSWLITMIIVTIVIAVGLYFLTFSFQGIGIQSILKTPTAGRVRKIRIHILILGALALVLAAVGHWFGRYELLYSSMGAVYGVGYAESVARVPARMLLSAVALIAAFILIISGFLSGYRLALGSITLWIGLSVLAGTVYPSMIQRIRVEPNELAREEPFLRHNIEHTRSAYGISSISTQIHAAKGTLDQETINNNAGTINNIRLWDEGPLLDIYNQIQFFRLYYDFREITSDRYTIDGKKQQVMLSAREISPEKLDETAQTWVNEHLVYTHGYGVAASPVNEVAADGRPSFLIKDVPPVGNPEISRPEIYYGLESTNFLITGSNEKEFDYSMGEESRYANYEGEGGVSISSFFRKFIYAWEFLDINILISPQISDESRIQYRRDVLSRFETLTPFLTPDSDPYIVVADGKLYWILDAYTTTNRYPYSTPANVTTVETEATTSEEINYIRNSVKVVIDTYNGTVQYYQVDTTDPIINTYAKIYPNVFQPLSEMPISLQAHIRYPKDYFAIQTEMLLQYHMTDPRVFYNKEDQWSLPVQSSFGTTTDLLPYYILANLPQQGSEEFLLIQPFTPSGRHNLIAWIAARNDAPHYGELVLYTFPSGRHIDGPNQIEARIDNDAVISEQFTLWGQVGSEVSRGILLVIPVGDSILYAEPIFLKPEGLDFPELRRIILADATSIVMEPTLQSALNALTGGTMPAAKVDKPKANEQSDNLIDTSLDIIISQLESKLKDIQSTIDQLRSFTIR